MDTKKLRYLMRFIPDKSYLKICYRLKTHKKLNLKNPQTFNEKIQWLKLYNRKPEYTTMVDKYRVRDYIKEKIGEEYLIPLVGGPYTSVDEIDLDALPDQFVLKCNHDSGSVVICRDKKDFDFEAARQKLDDCLKHNFWYLGREWPYKDVKPCIIAEKYMVDESGSELKDYKFYCFNGIPYFLYVSQGLENHETARISFLNLNWSFASFSRSDYQPLEKLPPKPLKFDEMISITQKLSKDIPFLRVDLYEINGQVYFGELTFFAAGGFMPFYPKKADLEVGKLLDIKGR